MDPCIKTEEIKEIKIKLEEYEKRIRDIETDRKLQMFQYQQIMDKLGQLDIKVEGILGKPSQYLNVGIGALITVVITVIATVLINKAF